MPNKTLAYNCNALVHNRMPWKNRFIVQVSVCICSHTEISKHKWRTVVDQKPNVFNVNILKKCRRRAHNTIYRMADIMQQSKALFFFNFKRLLFFRNFIFQKQKTLEITSNFRISLDLFELATFGINYGLQTADKAITGCTKVSAVFWPNPGEAPSRDDRQ